jgi:two-component system alkaline phosphatase synthesis response regulator PhoP
VTRILVVEDQRDLALGLRANLEVEGYDVDVAGSGEDALRIAADRRPDVVILDIMLPGIDGYEVLANLRAMRLTMPVLMLTARAEEVDKVRGFRTGADDYVTKPFGVMELLVRIQALLRRGPPRDDEASRVSSPGSLRLGDVEVDLESHTVRRNGEELSLTPKAVELLLALHRKQGKVVSRHELLRDVWGYTSSVTTRTVDAHVAELRRKLEADPADPKHILTVWKVGYRLRA